MWSGYGADLACKTNYSMGSKGEGLLSHRFGKTVKSDSFDGNMTIWYHAAALLCLGRGTSVVVLDPLFLLYLSRARAGEGRS